MDYTLHNPTKRVTDILILLSQNPKGLTLKEISEKLKIPKSTIFPILQTLIATKFISKDEYTMNYHIGLNAFKTGYAFLEHFDILEVIKKHMHSVVDKSDEICQLGILDKTDVTYIAKIEPLQPIKLQSSVGKSLPAHATALGKALLSKYEDKEIRQMYKKGLQKITDKTITDIEVLITELHEIKKSNIAHEVSEIKEEVECLAVTLKTDGNIFASISVSIPIYRSSKKKAESIKKILLEAKYGIEKELDESSIGRHASFLF